jgi:hypothetical protein
MNELRHFRVVLDLVTPYNPHKWDWDELVASQTNEQVRVVDIIEDRQTLYGRCDYCDGPYLLGGDDHNPETGCHYECEKGQ